MIRCCLSACALVALSSLVFGAGENDRPISEPAPVGPGTPATFAWGDVDGDGKLELAAVSADGKLQLLANAGGDRFEDVSERVGLAGITDAALALWVDYDVDGRLDLFVGARAGASRLFRNEGGLFVDMTAGVGLATEGSVRSADWLDHDGDGRADLHVVTAERHELYRGLEGGFFERAELPTSGAGGVIERSGVVLADATTNTTSASNSSSDDDGSHTSAARTRAVDGTRSSGSRVPLGPAPIVGSALPIPSCASSIQDQANPGTCLTASTTPSLGQLYPLSANLFVAVSGEVGIGTTSPSARLDVAGTARITDTLTLAPSGDVALDVSTGSIYKGGALFIHTNGYLANTAIGSNALSNVSSDPGYGLDGSLNTAVGVSALYSNTTGSMNTATGAGALSYNTTGYLNTVVGANSLVDNTTGSYNTALGANALTNNTGEENTASGVRTLFFNTTGSRNTATGHMALFRNTTASYNTAIGYGALEDNTTASDNTASGSRALFRNNGSENTANGSRALQSNTTGSNNTASGSRALWDNTTGLENTANGALALQNNTTGSNNTAIGSRALNNNTTGARNIAVGRYAGRYTTGNDNIDIGNNGVVAESATIRIGTAGTQTRAFVAGIRGVTTGFFNAIPVLVDSAGQLGTTSSSARFKQDVEDMGDRTERLLELRPVVFRYRQQQTLRDGRLVPLEYGLIAEEVAEVFPDLVVYDEDGKPFTVKYHLLSAMLLNELQKLHERDAEQSAELTRLRRLEARVDELETRSAGDDR